MKTLNPKQKLGNLRGEVVGVEQKVPLLNGGQSTYINFDNAASTPVSKPVLEAINKFADYYSSVHRGNGFKSQLSTKAYDDAREIVLEFFGGNPSEHVAIFGKNTTEAINKLSYRLGLRKSDVVLVGLTEHHSNDLPWRRQATVRHIKVDEQGSLSMDDLAAKLKKYARKVKLVALSGGSNVTGSILNIDEAARLTHSSGAQLFVDCAQLAPHRQINIKNLSDPTHIDYISVSAHKMYAPFGTGALIGKRETFEQGDPELCGGGTIAVVTEDTVEWAPPPDRDEAGSPNVMGAVAFARALQFLRDLGMDSVAEHEAKLTAYALNKLAKINGLKIYGDTDPTTSRSRLGVISFNVGALPSSLVSAVLGVEWGIGVRSGCFCAHPYVMHLLGLSKKDTDDFRKSVMSGDRRHMPGMVRVSFGVYNNSTEIDRLAGALEQIANGAYEGIYEQDKLSGDFHAKGWRPNFDGYFSLSST